MLTGNECSTLCYIGGLCDLGAGQRSQRTSLYPSSFPG